VLWAALRWRVKHRICIASAPVFVSKCSHTPLTLIRCLSHSISPLPRTHSLSHMLSEVTTRAHTLSCQAAAAAAKAAGAKGLRAGEEARARAAQAEAEGLRVSVGFVLRSL
jgi:hypothetical protein